MSADIPPPATSWFPLLPRFRCRYCQAAWWTRAGYRGHYALAHIVESADSTEGR